jgi:hypothetical protein
VKMSFADDAELSSWEGLNDAELLGRVRDGFKKFRARDGLPGNVASSKEIELTDHTADDPPPTPGTPRSPQRNGKSIAAADAAIPGYSRLSPAARDKRI